MGKHGADGAGAGNDIESEGDDEDSSKGSCGVGGGADDVVSMGDENSEEGSMMLAGVQMKRKSLEKMKRTAFTHVAIWTGR